MKESEVIKHLSALAKLRGLLEDYQQELDELEDQAFLNSPDLNGRRWEIIKSLEVLSEKHLGLTGVINEAVLGKGGSVKGKELQAVYSNGRTTWDGQKLAGYAIAHPEIEKLKKVGKPSVSIREVTDKNKS